MELSAVELAEVASVCQALAALVRLQLLRCAACSCADARCACQSVTFAAGVAAARITGLGGQGAPPAKPAQAASADAMPAAFAALSAQWLTRRAANPGDESARAAASEQAGAPMLQALAGEDGWRLLQEAPADASAVGSSEAQTSASKIWDTARLALAVTQPASTPASATGSSLQSRRRDGGDDARPASECVLPSLLLQALAPLPRQQLLQASMAALYAQLPDVVAKARAGGAASLDWEQAARKALAAAVVSSGRAWFAGYPQFQAELAAGTATQPERADSDAGAALALASDSAPDALARAQPLSFVEALANAADAAAGAEALGGRSALYGTLMQSLTRGEATLRGADWGASGTLLGGACNPPCRASPRA